MRPSPTAHLPRPRLRRHPPAVGRPRQRRRRAAPRWRRRDATAPTARDAAGRRRRQRGRARVGMAVGDGVSRSRLPPHRGVRRVRRDRRRRAPAGSTARTTVAPGHRRQHGVGDARVPRRRLLDQAAAPWIGGARGVHRGALAAHGATGRRPCSRAASGFTDPFGPRRHRPRGPARRPRQRWETPRIAFKPYPACHYIHAVARRDGAGADGGPGAVDDIDEIVALTPEAGVSLVLEPLAGKNRPRTEYEAKFSLPYSVARCCCAATSTSRPTPTRRSPTRRAGAGRQGQLRGQGLRDVPQRLPGGTRVRTRDGRVLEADCPISAAAREPDERRGGPREVPRQRRPRARRRTWTRSRTRS